MNAALWTPSHRCSSRRVAVGVAAGHADMRGLCCRDRDQCLCRCVAEKTWSAFCKFMAVKVYRVSIITQVACPPLLEHLLLSQGSLLWTQGRCCLVPRKRSLPSLYICKCCQFRLIPLQMQGSCNGRQLLCISLAGCNLASHPLKACSICSKNIVALT